MNKRHRHIPKWAEKERLSDMAWIIENFEAFWPAAQQQYRTKGRGAIVVDTMDQVLGGGHPFYYCTRQQIQDNEDAQRMIGEYDPNVELVVLLLKPEDRMSIYRFQVILRQTPNQGGLYQ